MRTIQQALTSQKRPHLSVFWCSVCTKYKNTHTPSCVTPTSETWLINNAGEHGAACTALTSTYRSHLLSAGDVLQNLIQLLLNAAGPVHHPEK